MYQNHPEWLVHSLAGEPIHIGTVTEGVDKLFALDTTHSGAQAYSIPLTLRLLSGASVTSRWISWKTARLRASTARRRPPLWRLSERIAMQYLAEAKVDLSRGRHRRDKKTGVTILLPHGDKRHILSHPVSWPISRYGILISAISQTPSTFISRHYSYSAVCIRACLPFSRSLRRQV